MKPTKPSEWNAALDSLPSAEDNDGKIPAFFIAHGSPMWIWPAHLPKRFGDLGNENDPDGPNVAFLKDFGRILMQKYNIKGIVIFSAHWDTTSPLVTDYGETENPLLYDYYGFPEELYTQVYFKSKGSNTLSRRVVQVMQDSGLPARLSPITEPRGRDGRGGNRPGLDHGVFIPLTYMFPGHSESDSPALDIPVVEVSLNADLTVESNEALGRAVSSLRSENILILSGGLTVHTFEDFSAFSESKAKPVFKEWDRAVVDAVEVAQTPLERQANLHNLIKHPGCKLAHPHIDHFIPLYIGAGAGRVEEEDAKVVSGLYGATTIAFGIKASK